MSKNNTISISNLLENFPFKKIGPKQLDVLQQIGEAINTGYKYIVLEAPTGFGKSPVAISMARSLGSSYFCSATKDLQSQYARDFPFLRAVKGMSNFNCLVKEDFIKNKTYVCNNCRTGDCYHTSVEFGPCRNNQEGYKHIPKICQFCRGTSYNINFHEGCGYRTYPEDYELRNRNTNDELIEMYDERREEFEAWCGITNNSEGDLWIHPQNLNFKRDTFLPCPYYDQLNKGIVASHSIFNYTNFLTFLRLGVSFLTRRALLVLDEGHSIEDQIIDQVGLSLSNQRLKRYISLDLLESTNFDYNDSIESRWLPLLKDISLELNQALPSLKEETLPSAKDYLDKIDDIIREIENDPLNWLVSNIITEDGRVSKVEFKPLDVSRYCEKLFQICDRTLIMSATILDAETYCRNIGLDTNEVKFITVGSDFPVENRLIHQLNIAYLNYNNLRLEKVQREISNAVDKILMAHHREKGIIHCTSYNQVNFISKYISEKNRKRLLLTDQDGIQAREDVIENHLSAAAPTVLISPSLHTGLNLIDDSSRFQIIVKIPYPNRSDRWIEARRMKDPAWYIWRTSIRLVQAYGRSVRSKNDWAKTYVLDSGFKDFVKKGRFPPWFKEAIVESASDHSPVYVKA